MGQYYYTVNLDKRQFLDPQKFGEGLKLMEFGNSSGGTMTALAVLLSDGNGSGGGDLRVPEDGDPKGLVGSWAGDRIVVAGDYAEGGKWLDIFTVEERQAVVDKENEWRREQREKGAHYPEDMTLEKLNLYDMEEFMEDVSDDIIRVIVAAEGEYSKLSAIDLDSNKSRFAQVLEAMKQEQERADSRLREKVRREVIAELKRTLK